MISKTPTLNQPFIQSLKPLAIEEFLDYYFYRRVAYLMIPALKKTGITPNGVTTISLLCGLIASFLIYHLYFVAGSLMAIIAILFDCCDGQLARLTGQSSPIGRALDGLFDAIWITTYWLAIYHSGYFDSLNAPWILGLMISSAAFVFVHCWRFDGVKIKYLELSSSSFNEQDLDTLQAWQLMKDEWKKFHLFTAFVALCMAFQMYFFVRGSQKKSTQILSVQQREKNKQLLEPIIDRWSWLGEGHHNTLIILGTFMAPLTPWVLIASFVIILIPMNLWYVFCEVQFKKACSSL